MATTIKNLSRVVKEDLETVDLLMDIILALLNKI